ncbi:hypothetical protein JD844_028765 [Phrynosoma platyrhinos]|uniref:deoxyribose-phosphate aldolase n=1 Tax=Phrynosoma platyrhinos TaxID=52577 RepID=A0ABQ7SIF8_PHRPL|nr:hypothetical protein JD844_028765 [Phrynosoma platyrhinos]
MGIFPPLDLSWLARVRVNQPAVLRRAAQIQTQRAVKKNWQAAWLLRAVTCIDLTTLSGDDTPSNVCRLCYKAKHPIREDLLQAMNMHDQGITTAAVCVYPARVADAVKALKAAGCNIPVASVLFEEIRQFRQACGEAHMKTILGTGELGSLTNVYKASLVAMMAGNFHLYISHISRTLNENTWRALVQFANQPAYCALLWDPKLLGIN